jgi:hypothetical protein
MRHRIITPREIEFNGKLVTALWDEQNENFLSSRETLEYIGKQLEVIEKLQSSLSKNGFTDSLDRSVTKERKFSDIQFQFATFANRLPEDKDNGKMTIVSPRAEYKEFDLDKRIWGFTCACCGNKVSGKTHAGYYTMTDHVVYRHHSENGFIRTCDSDCMMVVAKELVRNWIHAGGYEEFFDLEDIEEMDILS